MRVPVLLFLLMLIVAADSAVENRTQGCGCVFVKIKLFWKLVFVKSELFVCQLSVRNGLTEIYTPRINTEDILQFIEDNTRCCGESSLFKRRARELKQAVKKLISCRASITTTTMSTSTSSATTSSTTTATTTTTTPTTVETTTPSTSSTTTSTTTTTPTTAPDCVSVLGGSCVFPVCGGAVLPGFCPNSNPCCAI